MSEIIKNASFGPIAQNDQDYAGDIHSSGAHLLSLINEVLVVDDPALAFAAKAAG